VGLIRQENGPATAGRIANLRRPGTSCWPERLRRMIRHFALAFILVQVATAAALATQVFLFTSANAGGAATARARPMAAACGQKTSPDIHGRCLPRVEPKEPILVLSAER
jgi:hypothetical protein